MDTYVVDQSREVNSLSAVASAASDGLEYDWILGEIRGRKYRYWGIPYGPEPTDDEIEWLDDTEPAPESDPRAQLEPELKGSRPEPKSSAAVAAPDVKTNAPLPKPDALWHSPDGEAWATIGGWHYPVKSDAFRDWLAARLFERDGKAARKNTLDTLVTVRHQRL